jgi:Zn-dependent protease
MTPVNDMLDALAFYVVFVFAATVHEAAHAWAAKLGGDLTAYHGGQVSLSPLPHMRREPFGMVLLPLLTVSISGWPFGYASAPYDPAWAQRFPRRAAWMALAGPAANLALVLLAAIVIRTGVSAGLLAPPGSIFFAQVTAAAGGPSSLGAAFAFVLSVFFSMNLLLFLLNMLPVPPLDGSGALPLLLPRAWNDAYRGLVGQPMLGFVGILLAWQVFAEIFHPCFFFAIRLLYPEVRYG